MDIKIEEQKQSYAIIRELTTTQMKLTREMAPTMGSIKQYMDEKGIALSGAPFVIYKNNEPRNLNVDIGYPVSEAIEVSDGLKCITTKEGKAVVCVHEGGYMGLRSTYKKMEKWMKSENLIPEYVAYEYYLNSPQEVKTKELRTKIVLYIQ